MARNTVFYVLFQFSEKNVDANYFLKKLMNKINSTITVNAIVMHLVSSKLVEI